MTEACHYECLIDYLAAVTAYSHLRYEAVVGSAQRKAVMAAMAGSGRPLAHPLAPLYLAVRAHGVALGDTAVALGAGYYLLQHSLHVIDDVQDGEACTALDGGVGVNVGMTLFLHAIDCLWSTEQTLRGGGVGDIRVTLLRSCTRMAVGQHRDLAGRNQLLAPAAAIELATEKNAIVSLLYEIVAELVAAPNQQRQRYAAIGNELATITQLIDDVAELFESGASADLRTGTFGVPVNLFLSRCSAVECERWRTRIATEREGVRADLCTALFASGTMTALAEMIERARIRVCDLWRALPCSGAYLAILHAWLDDLVALLYRPTELGVVSLVDTDWSDLSNADATLARRLVDARQATEERYARRGAVSVMVADAARSA